MRTLAKCLSCTSWFAIGALSGCTALLFRCRWDTPLKCYLGKRWGKPLVSWGMPSDSAALESKAVGESHSLRPIACSIAATLRIISLSTWEDSTSAPRQSLIDSLVLTQAVAQKPLSTRECSLLSEVWVWDTGPAGSRSSHLQVQSSVSVDKAWI